MKTRQVVFVLLIGAAAATAAWSGHELPVYPSYYPHEIEIATVTPERAAGLLVDGKLHAYLGAAPRFTGAAPEHLRTIESLGSFIVVRVNPSSPLAKDEPSICAVAGAVARAIAARDGLTIHPYPVTPWHGDYLHHVDLAETAKARLLGAATAQSIAGPKVKAEGFAKSLVPAGWDAAGAEWDAEIAEVRIADLLAPQALALNGWQGPPWLRMGWFHAHLLLADATAHANDNVRRLQSGEFGSPVERINLERDLVAALAASCRTIVAGYRVRRETINAEFSAGIENIAFDALSGLNAPIFIRTAKLKDFPWNGWLQLGIDGPPGAAWNPIAGFTDPFGQLLWSALGDPATIPSPYDSTWILNRVSDVETSDRK